MTDTRQMIRSANPVPTGAELLSDGELDALLHLTMQRSTDMDLKERPALDTQQPRNRWNGWPMALAAFAVVIIVGLVLFIAPGDDPPPVASTTTTEAPATTTTAAPVTTTTAVPVTTTTEAPGTTTTTAPVAVNPFDLAAIEEFVATFNSGDWEATLASLTTDAGIWNDLLLLAEETGAPIPFDENSEEITRLFRFWSTQQAQMTIDFETCERAPAGRISCRGTFNDVVLEHAPLGEASLSATFALHPDGRGVSELTLRENATIQAAYEIFFAWLSQNHADDNQILRDWTGRMAMDEAAIELWPTRTAEWIASLDQ